MTNNDKRSVKGRILRAVARLERDELSSFTDRAAFHCCYVASQFD